MSNEELIPETKGVTVILFGHRYLREPVEFMAHCSMKWATFLLSLCELLETGRVRPWIVRLHREPMYLSRFQDLNPLEPAP